METNRSIEEITEAYMDLQKAAEEAAKIIKRMARELKRAWGQIVNTYFPPTGQSRRIKLWMQYEKRKAKMSNNERRRKGQAMVRRPKRTGRGERRRAQTEEKQKEECEDVHK